MINKAILDDFNFQNVHTYFNAIDTNVLQDNAYVTIIIFRRQEANNAHAIYVTT